MSVWRVLTRSQLTQLEVDGKFSKALEHRVGKNIITSAVCQNEDDFDLLHKAQQVTKCKVG